MTYDKGSFVSEVRRYSSSVTHGCEHTPILIGWEHRSVISRELPTMDGIVGRTSLVQNVSFVHVLGCLLIRNV
jgi:hypothetical protein